ADVGTHTASTGGMSGHVTDIPNNNGAGPKADDAVFIGGAQPVSSQKSSVGHLLGAAGALEALVAVEALQRKVLPPTLNLTSPDPDCDLDYIPAGPREAPGLELALSNSFGFGGQNACLALAAPGCRRASRRSPPTGRSSARRRSPTCRRSR